MPHDEVPFRKLFKEYYRNGQAINHELETILRNTLKNNPSFERACPQLIQQYNNLLRRYLVTTLNESGEPFKSKRITLLPMSFGYGLLRSITKIAEQQLEELMVLRAKESLYGRQYLELLEADIHLVSAITNRSIYARQEAAYGGKGFRGRLIAQAIVETAEKWHRSANTSAQLLFSLGKPAHTYIFSESLFAKKEQTNFINKNPCFTNEEKEERVREWYEVLQTPFASFMTQRLGKQGIYVHSDVIEAACLLAYKYDDASMLTIAQERNDELERLIGGDKKMRNNKSYTYIKERLRHAERHQKAKHITAYEQQAIP